MKRNSVYTLMFIPNDNGKTFTIRIPRYLIRALIVFIGIFFSGIFLLLIKSGEIAAKLQVLSLIRMENEQLLKENDELRLISEKINNLDKISKYLYQISSLPGQNKAQPNNSINKDNSGTIDTFIESTPQEFQHYVKNEKLVSFSNMSPVEGWITRRFMPDSSSSTQGHQGLDFAAASGTPIKASAPGVVGKIENDKYFGLLVTILHENGYISKYGHCSQVLVTKHDRVNRGQTIALVGNTGRSTAPHLHYEVVKDGKNIDPVNFILFHNE